MSAPEDLRISVLAEKIAQDCRDIATTLLTTDGAELLETLDEQLAAMSRLVRDARAGRFASPDGIAVNPPRTGHDGRVRMNTSPVRSHRNVLAPPARLSRSETGSMLTLTLPIQYQGPPATLQGGFCSVLLDDVMWDAVHSIRPGISFTRSLAVEYLRPVPLGEVVTVTGHVTSSEGRKTFAEGAILDSSGQVCTTAQGLWIAPRTE